MELNIYIIIKVLLNDWTTINGWSIKIHKTFLIYKIDDGDKLSNKNKNKKDEDD